MREVLEVMRCRSVIRRANMESKSYQELSAASLRWLRSIAAIPTIGLLPPIFIQISYFNVEQLRGSKGPARLHKKARSPAWHCEALTWGGFDGDGKVIPASCCRQLGCETRATRSSHRGSGVDPVSTTGVTQGSSGCSQ